MEIINKRAEKYVVGFSSKEDELLAEIDDYTNQFNSQQAVMR